ncbi:MAG: methylmalonyl-CoA mutase family protein [Methyloligellaceae bacterium]
MSELSLAKDFPAVDDAQWRELVEKALKGADFEKALVSTTYDGLRIDPLATRGESGTAPIRAMRTAVGDGTWDIRQLHAAPDPAATNAAILEDLEGGVSSIALQIEAPGQTGMRMTSPDDLGQALDGVHLDFAGVWLSPGVHDETASAALQEIWKARGIAGDKAIGGFGSDPIGCLARTGALPVSIEQALDAAARLAARTRDAYPNVTALSVDARPYHDGGASEAQELAALCATTVAYLRALEQGGLPPADGLKQLDLALAADADLFLTVAKLRAARALLARIAEASAAVGAASGLRLHVSTSARMMTRRNPHVNMLRTTIACAGAAIGGADAITVLPYSWALGRPDGFARRMARNTQVILQEESALGRVGDPSGGSWHLDTLTGDLAAKAWEIFQEIERQGGMVEALAKGVVQAMVRETAEARARDLTTAKAELTGVSAFPDLAEGAADTEPHGLPDALEDPAVTVEPVTLRREAEPFERLRDASDTHLAETGKRPLVFLANLGTPSDFTARATYAQSFFASGGIEAVTTDGFATAADAAAAFRGSGATAACLCSSDARYETFAEDVARALTDAGAAHIYLAGRPGDARDRYRSAGVQTFIHKGCDIIETLTAAHDLLGLRPAA